jgi:hypothetical protein
MQTLYKCFEIPISYYKNLAAIDCHNFYGVEFDLNGANLNVLFFMSHIIIDINISVVFCCIEKYDN